MRLTTWMQGFCRLCLRLSPTSVMMKLCLMKVLTWILARWSRFVWFQSSPSHWRQCPRMLGPLATLLSSTVFLRTLFQQLLVPILQLEKPELAVLDVLPYWRDRIELSRNSNHYCCKFAVMVRNEWKFARRLPWLSATSRWCLVMKFKKIKKRKRTPSHFYCLRCSAMLILPWLLLLPKSLRSCCLLVGFLIQRCLPTLLLRSLIRTWQMQQHLSMVIATRKLQGMLVVTSVCNRFSHCSSRPLL
mmetsp:Transcript_48730/g.146839  ORF Transcript_48730/g.146839 Transcript_48730/m.146839 type:complete len:245 (+) Transcript_48730:1809-2543(+)